MRDASAIIVGAGIGGLVAAVELACRGVEVTVLERAAGPGGKMFPVVLDGRSFDAGPTVFTMRWVLDAVCERAGTSLEALVSLERAETLARHWWPDGSRLDLFADAERSRDAVASFAGQEAAAGFDKFRSASAQIYRALERTFIEASRPSLPGLVARAGLKGLPGLAGIKPFATMWSELGRYFQDQRLRQLFGRYATYCGSSPFASPATLMLVAHVESEGVWLVREGMHGLAAALAGLAAANGARFRYGAHVSRLEEAGGSIARVRLSSGETLSADAVVWNGDASALAAGLAGPDAVCATRRVEPHARSLSAVTWNILTAPACFPLDRHNVFFSSDYAAEFTDIFARRRLPQSPTVYICAHDRPFAEDGSGAAGAASERLLCLVNSPASGDSNAPSSQEIDRCETSTFARLASLGLRINPTADGMSRRTPGDYDRLYPGTGGALYGLASHGWMASFQRPASTTPIPNLFLAGGSAHPGPGVPMAAISGRLAAEAALAALTSRAPYRRAAILGGISTARATTDSTR